MDNQLPVISSATDWVWYVLDDTKELTRPQLKARDYFITEVVPVFMHSRIPHQFVYDRIANTINFVCRVSDLHSTIELILTDAGFIKKSIPEEDWQSSKDLREAILGGSNMNKKWH